MESTTTQHGPSMIERAMEEESLIEDNGIYNFILHIGEISGLKPVYPVSELELIVSFNNEILFQSEKTLMTEIIAIEQDIILNLNIDDFDMLNQFVTTPILFSFIETDTTIPSEEITETGQVGKVLWRSEESVLDLEEALFGNKTDLEYGKSTTEERVDKKAIRKSKNKGSKSSQGSIQKGKKRKSSINMKDFEPAKPVGPQEAGTASIDLISLFLGDTEIAESLVLKAPAGQPLDDRMKSSSNLPCVQIIITVDKPLPSGNLFYYTMESIYNLPKVMSNNMYYELVIHIPVATNHRQVLFNTYTYAEHSREPFIFKKYYGTNSESNFGLRDDFDNVKTVLPVKLSEALHVDFPRLEFNIIKGEYATIEDINALKSSITKYRCIGMEFYMTSAIAKKGVSTATTDHSIRKSDAKSKKGSKKSSMQGKDTVSTKKEEDYLHLMSFIDVCRLLCPGEQRTRVACELRTFDLDEFEHTCGVKDSYFRPKQSSDLSQMMLNNSVQKSKADKKDNKKGDRSSNVSKGKPMESLSGKSNVKGSGNLDAKLPAPPATPELSQPVYSENGDPTFIIMEFELREPIVPALDIHDLHEQLENILNQYSKSVDEPRVFKSKYISKDIFQNSLRTVAQNLKKQYLDYISKEGKKEELHGFLDFLAKNDQYQIHLNTLTKSAAAYCNVALNYDPNWTQEEYYAFIGESYIAMVDLLNSTLTQMNLAGDESVKKGKEPDSTDEVLFYAKEATELGAFGLSTRYYLQRIAANDKSVESWLDYAIYKLHIDEPEAALECVMEALSYNKSHHDSLLFFSCLIARKGQLREAETCLLNLTICKPKWVQGWMALYCIYQRSKNFEGMELCLEMAEKYESVKCHSDFGDLAWTPKQLPHKYTFRAITYFIYMRLFEEAELIIANEVIRRQTDMTEFLLAVINMYKGHYEHALNHIERSFQLGSCSYLKSALRGHIYSHLGRPENAIFEYENIIKTSEDIPFDSNVYLVYLKAGICYSALGTHQTARKVLLTASEKRGTPYSWLTVGVLYYHQSDYLTAEECLTISNTMDNLMPETWAYLTLVNIKLGRPNEATNCYHQALDRRLQNTELLKLIDEELKKWEDDFMKTS